MRVFLFRFAIAQMYCRLMTKRTASTCSRHLWTSLQLVCSSSSSRTATTSLLLPYRCLAHDSGHGHGDDRKPHKPIPPDPTKSWKEQLLSDNKHHDKHLPAAEHHDHDHHDAHEVPDHGPGTTMDETPVPFRPYRAVYDELQKKYNFYLFCGLGLFATAALIV